MLFNKRVPRFLYEVPEVTPAAPASPWAADAAVYFGEDAAVAANFDRYMREKQQPYVTQLEAKAAEPHDGDELWNDLSKDSATTARDLIASVYANEPDVVAAYDAIFAVEVAAAPVVTPPVVDEVPEWAKPLVEDHQTKRDTDAAAAAATEYANSKAALKDKHSLTDLDVKLIDPFVYSAGGDMELALVGYRAWQTEAGVAPVVPDPVVPPPVITDGVATPPLATQYTDYSQIGEAFRAFHARQAVSATPPPVVG